MLYKNPEIIATDTSEHNGVPADFNIPAGKAHVTTFRLSYAKDEDDLFGKFLDEFEKRDRITSLYTWFVGWTDPFRLAEAQIELALKHDAFNRIGEKIWWVDMEETTRAEGQSKNDLLNRCTKYFNRTTELLPEGWEMGVYTRATWLDVNMPLTSFLWRLKLFVADWRTGVSEPLIPAEWKNHGKSYYRWQYSSKYNKQGYVHGYPTRDLDLSVYGVPTSDFLKNVGRTSLPTLGEITPPPDPEPDWSPAFGVIRSSDPTVKAVNIRKGFWGTPVGMAYVGTSWFFEDRLIDQAGSVWYQVSPGALIHSSVVRF